MARTHLANLAMPAFSRRYAAHVARLRYSCLMRLILFLRAQRREPSTVAVLVKIIQCHGRMEFLLTRSSPASLSSTGQPRCTTFRKMGRLRLRHLVWMSSHNSQSFAMLLDSLYKVILSA